jgi:hypothetical protein
MTTCNSCETHFNIGCFGHCEVIETEFVATETGEHIIMFNFLGAVRPIVIDLEIGDPINIPVGSFNEDSEQFFTIQMPSGDDFTYTADETEYACFKVKTRISF